MWFGFLAIGQGIVKRSRKILGHGQVVKVQNWPVKDLDPGRGWIHCVYGSDHPKGGSLP